MKALNDLLANLIEAHGEGPWLMIRPYDTGTYRVWAYVPSDQHDGDDEVAQAKGDTVESAARAVHFQLLGGAVCGGCSVLGPGGALDEMGWTKLPNGFLCPSCRVEFFGPGPDAPAASQAETGTEETDGLV